MDDEVAWGASVSKLFPLIHDGEIKLIGLACGQTGPERIPGQSLTLTEVLSPFCEPHAYLSAHIECSPFLDKEHWARGLNDKVYQTGRASAAWTHLQVRKADVLKWWPKPKPTVKAQQECYRWLLAHMRQSSKIKIASKQAMWNDAKQGFRPLSKRQFDRMWHNAIDESGAQAWAKAGRPSKK